MKKTSTQLFRYTFHIIAIGAVFYLGYFVKGTEAVQPPPPDISDDSTQERNSQNYTFISPLLECDIKNGKSQQKYIPFEDDVKKKIEETIIAKNPNVHVALYFRNLKNGPWFGINEEEGFAPASLMKLPIAMSYMKWSETNKDVLTQRLSVHREDASIQNFIPGSLLDTGSTYSVLELISRALIYSDNDANRTLVDNIPGDTLMGIYKDLGIPIIDKLTAGINDYISVKEYASFFRILYNASYLERSASENLLGILSQSKFHEGITKYIPASVLVAHKFGEREFYSPELAANVSELHDCGIVYYEHYPYLICIMTKGSVDFKTLEGVIQDISRLIYETIVKTYP